MATSRTRRTKRSPLSRERILDAAEALIEHGGLSAFSMRTLGAALGVEAMSLYHHYPSKAHLCDALLDRLLLRIPAPLEGVSWRARLRADAFAYRAAILSRPAFATFVLTHRMNTRQGLLFLERLVSHFFVAGVTPELAARMFRSLGYYLMGALMDETAGYANGPTAADALTLEQQREIAPKTLSLGPWFKPSEWEATFSFGLDHLLDGFEEEIARHQAGGPSEQRRE